MVGRIIRYCHPGIVAFEHRKADVIDYAIDFKSSEKAADD